MSIFSDTQNSDPLANPSTPPPKPLQVVSDGDGVGFSRLDFRLSEIVSAASNTPFELPDGWVVEARPRGPNSSAKISDKYYYEPGTGRQFRSLLSVKRYLNGEEEILPRKRQNKCPVPYQNSGCLKRVAYGGKVLRRDELEEAHHQNLDDNMPSTLQPKASSLIPDGWIVGEVPRNSGLRNDRYYIEPVTGQKFRSVPEVQRYLVAEKYRSKCRALTFSNHAKGPRSPTPRKKNTWVKMLKDAVFDLTNPPEKVNWIYSSDGRGKWNPLLEKCVLPDYIKEQWAETFLLGMNGWKQRVPQLTMSGNNQASNA